MHACMNVWSIVKVIGSIWHEKFYLGRSEFVGRGGRRGLKKESMHKKEQEYKATEEPIGTL